MKVNIKTLSLLLFIIFCMIGQLVVAQSYHIDKQNSLPFNTSKEEYAPAFYKNGIAYVSGGGKSLYRRTDSNKRSTQYDIFYVLKNENGNWNAPKKFNEKVNSEFDEASIFFYDRGYNFVMTRNNIDPKLRRELIEKKKQSKNYSNAKEKKKEIRDAKKQGKLSVLTGRASKTPGGVTQIESLDINSLDYSIASPSITPDGKIMVVASNKLGGLGRYDLYKYTRNKGKWANMKPLSSTINSSANEVYPFILDNYTLFFASNKVGGQGGYDIYKVDGWQTKKPTITRLPYPINTPKDDISLILSHDRKSGYIASNREGGEGQDDIYFFTKKTKILNVFLVNQKKQPLSGKSLILKTSTDKIINSYTTDKNGKIKIEVQPKKDYIISYYSPSLQRPFFLNWKGSDRSIQKTLTIKGLNEFDENIASTTVDPLTAALNQKTQMESQITENREIQNLNKNNSIATVDNDYTGLVSRIEENTLPPINNSVFQETRNGKTTAPIVPEKKGNTNITKNNTSKTASIPKKVEKSKTASTPKKVEKSKTASIPKKVEKSKTASTPKKVEKSKTAFPNTAERDIIEEKSIEKINDYTAYLGVIASRYTDHSDANNAIELATNLFVNEDAVVQVSSGLNNEVKNVPIKTYLERLKLLKYDHIKMDWIDINNANNFKKGQDGNYYKTVSFKQTFKGYIGGKLVYDDTTEKNIELITKNVESKVNGNIEPTWKIFINNISVGNTKVESYSSKDGIAVNNTTTDSSDYASTTEAVTNTSTGNLMNMNTDIFKETISFKGKLTNSKNKPSSNAKILIEDMNGKLIKKVNTDNNGNFESDLDRFSKYWITVENGSEFINPILLDTGKQDEPRIFLRTKSSNLKNNSKVPLKNLHYKVSNRKLSKVGYKELLTLARFLNLESNKHLKIEINSYTDSKGSDWLNTKISQGRATNSMNKLIQYGVEAHRISAFGRGETNLINQCTNGVQCSDELNLINRRTEIIIK